MSVVVAPDSADASGTADALVPWWAVALLDLERSSPEWVARQAMQRGHRRPPSSPDGFSASFWGAWANVLRMARERVMRRSLDDWLDLAYEGGKEGAPRGKREMCDAIRSAALSSERAFCGFADLRDESDRPIILKDFHVRVIRDIRQKSPTVQLLPWEHGKSMLSSIVIPLMDWGEWNNATQIRIYLSSEHIDKWIRRLMGHVQYNENLHRLFPWIRKPVKGDRSMRWSVEGFSIGGRDLADVSFLPLTVQKWGTGYRGSRVIGDDWVTTGNASSLADQDRMYEYAFTGPMTMGQEVERYSTFGTRWGTKAFIGTLFMETDVNHRLYTEFLRKGYPVRKYDVYPRGDRDRDRGIVIWPEYKSFDYVQNKRDELGLKFFNMRMRNMVDLEHCKAFVEADVVRAEGDGLEGRALWAWGRPPDRSRLLIGFDPGSGKLRKESKNPAIVLYAEVDAASNTQGERMLGDQNQVVTTDRRRFEDVFCHIVKWQRLSGFTFTRQCDQLAAWAREYQCPVAVEDNATQTAYGDYVKRMYPDVKVISHTTNENKRDPRDGVEQFVPLFENGRVRIHAHGAPIEERLGLRREIVSWPNGRFTDLVMALWIAKYQMRLRRGAEGLESQRAKLPSYASGFGGMTIQLRRPQF